MRNGSARENKMPLICHFTSVHNRSDTRIFIRECCTLAESGYRVVLVVADGEGDAEKNDVKILDVGKEKNRINRMIKTRRRLFESVSQIHADVYHFHDPELIGVGLKLKKKGKKVIYDIHEDFPEQIKGKPYLHKFLTNVVSWVFKKYENKALKKFDHLITATPYIRDRFKKVTDQVTDINNYPGKDEFSDYSDTNVSKHKEVTYVGKITKIRGAFEMIEAIRKFDNVRLNLGGIYYSEQLRKQLTKHPGWENVRELGFLSRTAYRNVLMHSMAGLILCHPLPNYLHSQPNKIFEYMSAGLPVIASDFPLWKQIVEENECGICVDPLNPREIAKAIHYIVSNPQMSAMMGENGQSVVNSKYNWNIESRKLFEIYEKLLNPL